MTTNRRLAMAPADGVRTAAEPAPSDSPWTAIVLAGGAGSRMGREKPGIVLGGCSLVDHVLGGLPARVPVIVVGPALTDPSRPVTCTSESPAGGGPVAGLAAGLALVTTSVVGVIAADMPFASSLVARLATGLAPDADALVPVDATGHRQPLCAAYRTSSLRTALAALGEVRNASMRSLLDHLVVAEAAAPGSHALLDIDTPSDLDRSRAIMHGTKGRSRG